MYMCAYILHMHKSLIVDSYIRPLILYHTSSPPPDPSNTQFPHANISLILAKLRGPASAHTASIQKAFSDADTARTGKTPLELFRSVSHTVVHCSSLWLTVVGCIIAHNTGPT